MKPFSNEAASNHYPDTWTPAEALFPKNIPINQTEEYVCKALEHYNKFLRNRAERDSR